MTDTVAPDLETFRGVLDQEARAVLALKDIDAAALTRAFGIIRATTGRVVVSGMGKSGHVGRKIAATLASTGTPATFVHPAEASHGDLGMIERRDVLLMLSNSGETAELAAILEHAARFDVPMIAITRRATSTLARQAEAVLLLPDLPEACPMGLAPTTSTTATLALGDALAVMLMTAAGFTAEGFGIYHPGGKLGARLLRVEALMHPRDEVPVVAAGTGMDEGILAMTAGGFGVAAVVEDDRLTGALTDGDLRRNLAGLLERTAGQIANPNPLTVTPQSLASEALALMNRNRITSLFVCDDDRRLLGLLHVHDCLRAGVV